MVDLVNSPHQLLAEVRVPTACSLGEGVTWDAATDRLLWLDVDGLTLHRLESNGDHMAIPLTRRVSAVVPQIGADLIAATGTSVVELSLDGRFGRVIAQLPPDGDGNANDGRCDPRGRFWVGTVDRSPEPRGGLFAVESNGTVTRTRSGIGMSNGIDWSPDGAVAYHVDTLRRRVDRLPLSDDGLPLTEEVLTHIDAMPDGLSVDAEGCVWVALWDGHAVHRYTPAGELNTIVEVPHGFVTNCAFGGPTASTLFITTARGGMSADELADQPHAGALYSVEVGVAGRGYTPFGSTTGAD